jgi:alpha-1,3-fucosyltransferase
LNSDFENHYEEYGGFFWAENKTFDVNTDFAEGKTGLAVAVISNCKAASGRDEYIKEMQSHAELIDVNGNCGKTCPAVNTDIWYGDCKPNLAAKYKFYLAFENSYCVDYISEKFFQILRYNIVPVVLGGGDYSVFVPKSGYIDVRDFKSPKLLVEYLTYLDSNRTAYNAYFQWKRHVSFHNNHHVNLINVMCGMCIKLHLEKHFGVKRQILNQITDYWDVDTKCKNLKIKNGDFYY